MLAEESVDATALDWAGKLGSLLDRILEMDFAEHSYMRMVLCWDQKLGSALERM